MTLPSRSAARFAEVLDALAGDLSESEVRTRIDRLVGVLDDPAAARHLDASAGRVRSALRQAHRRQAEIAALYATARDLAEVRDVDEVLLRIVRRAQELMPSADAAYLVTRDDEHGGFRMRASVGLVSPAFKQVHVPAGTGMAARIVETRSAYWTRVYHSNRTIRHDDLLDRALAEDGLTSVLGTPLLVRAEVVGVLFAANREERSYSREEMAAQSAFADHAGVAMENARLFGELQAARAEARADLASLEGSVHLHDALADLVIRGGDASEVVEVLGAALAGEVAVTDPDGRVTAGAPVGDVAAQVEASRREGRSVVEAVPTGWRHVAAVGSGSTHLGALVLVAPDRLGPRDVRSLERAAQIVTLLVLRQAAVVEAEERVRGELLAELLGGPVSGQTRLRAVARRIDVDRPHVVVAVRGPEDRRGPTRGALVAAATVRGGLAGEHAGTLVALVPGSDADAVVAEVHARVRGLVCATDPLVPADGGVPAAAELAARCVRLLDGLGRTDAAETTRGLALYSALFQTATAADLRRYLDDRLGPLQEHDAETGSELLRTLAAYFAEETNVARTARALFVHTNTVVKRLDRIARLLGPRWEGEAARLELRVALHLHTVADPGGTHR